MADRYPISPKHVYSIEDHISDFFDRVVACANHRRLILIAEANEKRLEMAAHVTQRELSEQQLLATKADIEQKLRENILRSTQEELLTTINEKLAELRLPQPQKRLRLREDFERVEQLLLAFGEVIEEEVPAIPDYQQLRRVITVAKDGQDRGELSNPRGVAFHENSKRIFVAEQSPSRVSIFSELGEFVDTFAHEHMTAPHGIAIHRDNVYVTDTGAQGVFHFKIEADIRLVEALVGEGSAEGKFYVPGQLAVSQNGHVFVPDFINHRIQILDEGLNYQRSITHDTLHYPEDVKLTNNEVYILSSRDTPCVHAFSHDGEKLRSFITSGAQGMQVTSALFFTLDAQKNIMISDGDTNNIKVFSQEGTLLHTVEGFRGGTSHNPQGIALTNNLKLIVIAPKDIRQLQIFSC